MILPKQNAEGSEDGQRSRLATAVSKENRIRGTVFIISTVFVYFVSSSIS
jgi:hypothetical protein